MSDYIKKRARGHKVVHSFSNRSHFYETKSESGNKHTVNIQAGCDCEYMSVQGVANKRICSHIISVLDHIISSGNIEKNFGKKEMTIRKVNNCLQLVRQGNRKINDIRFSAGESKSHIDKKIEICVRLTKEGKDFITEAIIESKDMELRADIISLSEFKIIEIAHSEDMKSLMKKAAICEELGLIMEVVRC